jgi:methylated-DNA-[protein]-cysteine S-methyltransferase
MLQSLDLEISGVPFRLVATPSALRAIYFNPAGPAAEQRNDRHPVLVETARQLAAYFSGDLRRFDLALDFAGTPFQQRVWRELLNIPYGETRSYSHVAQQIGAPSSVRAVGAANGANPIPIIVPCHRVIGAGGNLVGYGGGLPLKRRLLALEKGSLFEA